MSVLVLFISVFFIGTAPQTDALPADSVGTAVIPDSMYAKVVPDSVRISILNSVNREAISASALSQAASSETTEEEVPDTVHVWEYETPVSFSTAETDSTLRWLNYLNLFDRFYREKGAATFRMGTVGRMDGIELHSYETRHMRLTMDGLQLNDLLTGAVNWNRLPVHKIAEMAESDFGPTYMADVRMRDHFIIEPRTYLNFDESKFNHRSLEFSYSQNFRKGTNLEFSFWDRRDGGGYRRQEVNGRQITARVYHQLTDTWLLKTGIINNGIDKQEPFGYSVNDPRFFAFNRFIESPLEGNANAGQSSSDIFLQLHHRADTTKHVSDILGFHYQTDNWDLSYSADTVAVSFQKAELFAEKRVQFASTSIGAGIRAFYIGEKKKENLTETGWLGGKAELSLDQHIGGKLKISSAVSSSAFDDGRQNSELSAKITLTPWQRFTLSGFGGVISAAPDIQSLYWSSRIFSGNPDLSNEEAVTAGVEATLGVGNYLEFGVRGDFRDTENAVFTDSTGFFNADPYSTTTGTAWVSLDSGMFEGEVSGTYRAFSSDGTNNINMLLDNSGDRIRLKGRLFWKNYVFDRAAFVKAGVVGHFLPNGIRAAEFITPLNRWQHASQELINPSHYRMDVEISARIRWFMMLLAWENVLDRAGQLGYFETVGYPMPERRFKFGVRVLFTN